MPRVKPTTPRWQPGRAPAGCKGYWLLHEGGGTRCADLTGRYPGVFVGSPTWGRGPLGAQLGGFTASNYAAADGAMAWSYPLWFAALAATSSTAEGAVLSLGNQASLTQRFLIDLNFAGTANRVAILFADDSGAAAGGNTTGVAACTDGQPHVWMAVAYGPSNQRLYLDGAPVVQLTTTFGAATFDQFSFGVYRRSTAVLNPFGGSLLAAARGWGAVPDPAGLADDWLTGTFAAARPGRLLSVPEVAIAPSGDPPRHRAAVLARRAIGGRGAPKPRSIGRR